MNGALHLFLLRCVFRRGGSSAALCGLEVFDSLLEPSNFRCERRAHRQSLLLDVRYRLQQISAQPRHAHSRRHRETNCRQKSEQRRSPANQQLQLTSKRASALFRSSPLALRLLWARTEEPNEACANATAGALDGRGCELRRRRRLLRLTRKIKWAQTEKR